MRIQKSALPIVLTLAALLPIQAVGYAAEALAWCKGSELEGGAKDLFGSVFDGEPVNYIYAGPTGKHARMQLKFTLKAVPSGALFAHIKARDDDGPSQCRIAIELNGKTLFKGPNTFSASRFELRKFAIPEGVLKGGENTLAFVNTEPEGVTGMPPWFQVAAVAIGASEYSIPRDLHKDFWVTLPKEKMPFPEPLPEGRSPGFKWRGTKGWMWTPKQYLSEIPVLTAYKLNFYMNCYTSMCDTEHYAWGDPNCNRWWEPLPKEKKEAYEAIVRECGKHQIQFCFSMNPNLCSKRFVNDGEPESVDQLYQHYAWMQSLGVKWFNISLDDITQGINAASQAKVVNTIFRRLRNNDPEAQMIFCPTFYWGDGTAREHRPYLETIARELDKDIYLFWTGDAVVGKITCKAAETYRQISSHRLFLWDNYPVNDNQPTMHLGPVIDRDPDLGEVVDGYMSNPLCQQNEINRIPLLTCLDYAWNPAAYDPVRSIGQAILHLANSPSQREVLKDLVEAYPGMLLYGNGHTGFNAVQHQYLRVASSPHSKLAAQAFIDTLQRLVARLQLEFPNAYHPEKKLLETDIQKLKTRFKAQYTEAE